MAMPTVQRVDVAQLVEHWADRVESGRRAGADAEEDGDLAYDDVDGDPGQDAGDHRGREQLGNPSETAHADEDRGADQQRT